MYAFTNESGRQEGQSQRKNKKITGAEREVERCSALFEGRQECRRPLEVRKGKGTDPPLEPPEDTQPSGTLTVAQEHLFQTSDFQNCEIMNCVVLNHRMCGHL